jgi:hypothetical protein
MRERDRGALRWRVGEPAGKLVGPGHGVHVPAPGPQHVFLSGTSRLGAAQSRAHTRAGQSRQPSRRQRCQYSESGWQPPAGGSQARVRKSNAGPSAWLGQPPRSGCSSELAAPGRRRAGALVRVVASAGARMLLASARGPAVRVLRRLRVRPRRDSRAGDVNSDAPAKLQ